MDSPYANNHRRTDQIRQAVRELARLIDLRYGRDSNWNTTQAEHIIHNLTDLLHDEQAASGMEQAIRDLYKIEYLRQYVLNGDLPTNGEIDHHLPSRNNKDTWQ